MLISVRRDFAVMLLGALSAFHFVLFSPSNLVSKGVRIDFFERMAQGE